MKGGIGWNLRTSRVDRDLYKFYLMFLSWEIDIKLCQICTKIFIFDILYKNHRFKQIIFSKYATNLKTTISQGSLKNLSLLLGFEFYNFSFLQLMKLFIRPYLHMTSILHCHWWEWYGRTHNNVTSSELPFVDGHFWFTAVLFKPAHSSLSRK